MTTPVLLAPDSAFRTCGRGCGAVIFDEATSGHLARTGDYRQRGVRLNTGTEHAIAFCQPCANRPIGDDGPAILAHNRQVFEEAWAAFAVPDGVRAQQRSAMATWTILGWAEEIPAPPRPACSACGGSFLVLPRFCPHCGTPQTAEHEDASRQ